MRLHLGAPREKLTMAMGEGVVSNGDGKILSFMPQRQITHMFGISWRKIDGFVFVGVQIIRKQDGET